MAEETTMPTPEDYAANKLKSIQGNSKPGPRTPEGKARSAINALRHGLSGRIVVLPSEDMSLTLTRHSRNQTGKSVTMPEWASNY